MPFGICTKPSKDDVAKEISVIVEIPSKSYIEVVLCKDALGLECLDSVAKQLGLTQTGHFGLCYKTKRGHEWWLILEKPIRKQLEKYAANYDLCKIELKFKIQFFMADSSWMRMQDKPTRNLYYLQLKQQILEGSLSCEKDTAVILASYSAQADLGDYEPESFITHLEGQSLFPCNVSAKHPKDALEQQVINLYQQHRGMTSEEAALEFVIIAQKLDGYGDEYYPAKDKDGFIILVSASFVGIVVRHPHGLPPAYFRWPDIIRMSHNKKYFCIESTKSFDVIQFEMEDAATAKYAWRMFVAHHQFCRLNLPRSRSSTRTSNIVNPGKLTLSKNATIASTNSRNCSPCSSRSVKGLVNPVFDVEKSFTEEKDMVDGVSRNSSSSSKAPSTLPRPQSLNFSATNNRRDFLLHDNLCTSQNSLDHNQGLYSEGLYNSAVTNEIGSSLSMDSGNPLGRQSLESLDDRSHSTRKTTSGEVFSASTPTARPSRPVSLNLEQQLAGDNSSEVTGQTSGYSTSNDSDLEDARELDFDDEDLLPSRETQLKELEKILNEGQVFTEFQKVERRSEKLTTASAQCGGNVEKNRYKDVVPYEETRVRLNPRNNSSGSDYINADFVKLDVGTRTYCYIATQGPMENTAADFWQMAWEQDVRIIVAATDDKINSKSACYPYWPEDSPGSRICFGSLEVKTVSIRDTASYKVRKLSLHHTTQPKHSRLLCHLHFTDWPDHGVPQDPKNFLEFLDELESARQQVSVTQGHAQEAQPVMVHCTAGVGRTGVIILTDLMIACWQSNQRINILKSLIQLRCQRMLLVANFGQYRFVYTTLIHFIKNSRLI